ncbi:MAG: cytochrome c [Deltaproteobacteria bacterium]|nr:cytochrome c [Deltaproteobacteria bacterium]
MRGQKRRGQRNYIWLAALALCGALGAWACSQAEPDSQDALLRRGAAIYRISCGACHHAQQPGRAGPIGPPLAGASMELLEAKVLRNEYPPGYQPLRDTNSMIALPHLAPDLPALHAFLQAAAPRPATAAPPR